MKNRNLMYSKKGVRYLKFDTFGRRPTQYHPHEHECGCGDPIQEKIRNMRDCGVIYLDSSPAFPYDIDTLYDNNGVSVDAIYYINCIKRDCLPEGIRCKILSSYVLHVFKEDYTQYQVLTAGTEHYRRYLMVGKCCKYMWSVWEMIDLVLPDNVINAVQFFADTEDGNPNENVPQDKAELGYLVSPDGQSVYYPKTLTNAVIDPSTGLPIDCTLDRTMISVETIEIRDKIPMVNRANGRVVRVNSVPPENKPKYYHWDAVNAMWAEETFGRENITINDIPGLTESIRWHEF